MSSILAWVFWFFLDTCYNLIYFTSQLQFSLPSLHFVPPTAPQSTTPLFQKEQDLQWELTNRGIFSCGRNKLLPFIKVGKVNSEWSLGLPKALGTSPASVTRSTTKDQLSHLCRGSILVSFRLDCSQSRVYEIIWDHVSYFCGFFHDDLEPLPHTILPFYLQQDFLNSTQCLALDQCIYCHQSWEEGSLMVIGVVTNPIIGNGQVRLLSTIDMCLSWCHLVDSWDLSLHQVSTWCQNTPHQDFSLIALPL